MAADRMSDESFFREVDEEIRQEKAKAFFQRYGLWLAVAAVLVVLGTAAYTGYRYWTSQRAGAAGDAFSNALALAQKGDSKAASSALEHIEKHGYGAYPVLARMRLAGVLEGQGDFKAAVKDFDAVSSDGSAPQSIRDIARLRAGLILVDHGSYADVVSRVKALTEDDNPLRFSAREALGLAAWKAGKAADALKEFDAITADPTAPGATRQRAGMMAELIRSSGKAS